MADPAPAPELSPLSAPSAPATPEPAAPDPALSPGTQKLYGAETSGGDSAAGTDTVSGPDTASGTDSVVAGSDTSVGPDGKKIEGAPAPDAIVLKLPDGVEANAELLTSFTTLATESGLNTEKAQKLLDMHLAEVGKINAATEKAWTDQVAAWKTAIDKDPDIGGEKTAAAQVVIARALDTYGSSEARAAFEATGAGWNPAIIKFVHKMAAALNEGSPISPGGPRGQKAASPAARLYGEPTT